VGENAECCKNKIANVGENTECRKTKKHVLFDNRKDKYHKTMELLNEYPNIKDLADESIHYMVSQRAMAKYLGLTKQSVSRAILSTDVQ
jgi:hypothetical protein